MERRGEDGGLGEGWDCCLGPNRLVNTPAVPWPYTSLRRATRTLLKILPRASKSGSQKVWMQRE